MVAAAGGMVETSVLRILNRSEWHWTSQVNQNVLNYSVQQCKCCCFGTIWRQIAAFSYYIIWVSDHCNNIAHNNSTLSSRIPPYKRCEFVKDENRGDALHPIAPHCTPLLLFPSAYSSETRVPKEDVSFILDEGRGQLFRLFSVLRILTPTATGHTSCPESPVQGTSLDHT